ncbi:hypothetical protein NDU88_001255 [Pleurodeles waltl]|uniref:Uncharacterized protein n=1 Tax=Pleurodeles waltl TaxID=8319 RepID=A0AAV7Q6I6_PLEWA|nr:hypothetical protein NDU88_001255 [Pleurodeles waltl]
MVVGLAGGLSPCGRGRETEMEQRGLPQNKPDVAKHRQQKRLTGASAPGLLTSDLDNTKAAQQADNEDRICSLELLNGAVEQRWNPSWIH